MSNNHNSSHYKGKLPHEGGHNKKRKRRNRNSWSPKKGNQGHSSSNVSRKSRPKSGKSGSGRHSSRQRVMGWIQTLTLRREVVLILLVLSMAIGLAIGTWLTSPPPIPLNQKEEWETLSHRLGFLVEISADGAMKFIEVINPLPVPEGNLPKWLPKMLKVQEDKRFNQHFGVDPLATLGAIRDTFAGTKRGGSGITQQLIKLTLLNNSKTLTRKVREARLAFGIENLLNKNEIIRLYLDRAPFGRGTIGIQAAARRYFAKNAHDLTPFEGALLLQSLTAPSTNNFHRSPIKAKKRANHLLRDATAKGVFPSVPDRKISKGRIPALSLDHSSLFNAAAKELRIMLPDLRPGRYWISTTIDTRLQELTENVTRREAKRLHLQHGASQLSAVVMGMDGRILSMVGASNRKQTDHNLPLDSSRQLASVIKPFIYLGALVNGGKPTDTVSGERIRIRDWKPKNANRLYPRRLTLTKALAESCNTCAVRVYMDRVGPDRLSDVLKRIQLPIDFNNDDLTVALGTPEARSVDVTAAYTAIANGGRPVRPHFLAMVRDGSGNILYHANGLAVLADTVPEFPDQTIQQMQSMLETVVQSGTGRGAAIPGFPVFGKSGTSQNYRDARFEGCVTNLFCIGLWAGNLDGKPMKNATGSKLVPLWRKITTNLIQELGDTKIFTSGT